MGKKLNIEDIELELDEEDFVNDDPIDNDDESEVDIDDGEEEDGEVIESKEDKTVPLKALEAERRKYKQRIKELEEEKLREKEEKESAIDEDALYTEYLDEYIEDGMTEALAAKKAKRDVKRDVETNDLKKLVRSGVNTSVGTKYDVEFEKLQSRIKVPDDRKDELVKEARRTGYTLEQVHTALYGTAAKVSADERKRIEQQMIVDRERKINSGVKINAGNKSTPKGPDLGLSQEQKEFCQQYGIDPKRYAINLDNELNADTHLRKTTKRKKE
jgi:hypothetical protein